MIVKIRGKATPNYSDSAFPDIRDLVEPETRWHPDWKNLFPEAYRQVIFTDLQTRKVHRADIHTSPDVMIEFQNSPLSIEELKCRGTIPER